MAGTYSKIKTVITGDTITASDRNAEHENHINNCDFSGLGDYSDNVTQMRATTDPYPSSVESLATDGRGELERIRYVLTQLSGKTYWYQDPSTSIETIVSGALTIAGVKTFSSGLIGPAGTASAVSFGVGAATSGMYLSTTNTIGFSTNSIARITINADGDVSLLTGTLRVVGVNSASYPDLSRIDDTNTGLRFLGSDVLALTTAGGDRFTINASGEIGIGTTSPGSFNSNARNLVIANSAGNVGMTLQANAAGSCYIGFADVEGTTIPGLFEYNHNATAAAEYLSLRVGGEDDRWKVFSTHTELYNGVGSVSTYQLMVKGYQTGWAAAIMFASEDGAGTNVEMGRILFTGTGGWSSSVASQDSTMEIRTTLNGTAAAHLILDGDGRIAFGRNAVINGAMSIRTDSAEDAKFLIRVNNATGDPSIGFTTNATDWTMGADNSDSDSFVLSQADSLGSTNRIRVTTSGQTQFSDGSVSAPGISFLSETNTGFRRASSGNLAVVVGGSDQVNFISNGNVLMSNIAPLATTATDGFIHIARTTGTPTGVPNLFTGLNPMVWDSGANKLWVYSSGWKGVVLS